MRLLLLIGAATLPAAAIDYGYVAEISREIERAAPAVRTAAAQARLNDALVRLDLALMGLSANPPVPDREAIVELHNTLLNDLERARARLRSSSGTARSLELQNMNRLLNLIRWTGIEIAEMRDRQRTNVSKTEFQRITSIRHRIRRILPRAEDARRRLAAAERTLSSRREP